jgi:hypothetical protein
MNRHTIIGNRNIPAHCNIEDHQKRYATGTSTVYRYKVAFRQDKREGGREEAGYIHVDLLGTVVLDLRQGRVRLYDVLYRVQYVQDLYIRCKE